MKNVVSVVLLLFVLASGAYMIYDGSKTDPASVDAAAVSQVSPESAGDQITVYYFHGDVRCPTCIKIEALSTEAIQKGFAEEIEAGRLVWQAVNTDQPENAHFVNDYELYTKSLVVVKTSDGVQTEWKNLPQIWELVSDDNAFIEYVDTEVKAYLGEV